MFFSRMHFVLLPAYPPMMGTRNMGLKPSSGIWILMVWWPVGFVNLNIISFFFFPSTEPCTDLFNDERLLKAVDEFVYPPLPNLDSSITSLSSPFSYSPGNHIPDSASNYSPYQSGSPETRQMRCETRQIELPQCHTLQIELPQCNTRHIKLPQCNTCPFELPRCNSYQIDHPRIDGGQLLHIWYVACRVNPPKCISLQIHHPSLIIWWVIGRPWGSSCRIDLTKTPLDSHRQNCSHKIQILKV